KGQHQRGESDVLDAEQSAWILFCLWGLACGGDRRRIAKLDRGFVGRNYHFGYGTTHAHRKRATRFVPRGIGCSACDRSHTKRKAGTGGRQTSGRNARG